MFVAIYPPLPSSSHPCLIYSNETRDDLQLLFCQALRQADHSIYFSMYGITDPIITEALKKQAARGIEIAIDYDPSASSKKLLRSLPSSICTNPIAIKGLMHRKMIIIDNEMVFLGSANLTPASLCHHDNLVIGLHDPQLAEFLRHPNSSQFTWAKSDSEGALWLLPDGAKGALDALLSYLTQATRSIHIAMFTFTHPRIVQALIGAKNRGVDVRVAIDRYTAKGASKKALVALENGGITVLIHQGPQLLHHKWAWIDDSILIMGSANWTQAAFKKNHDFLLVMTKMPAKCKRTIRTLWNYTENDSQKPISTKLTTGRAVAPAEAVQ